MDEIDKMNLAINMWFTLCVALIERYADGGEVEFTDEYIKSLFLDVTEQKLWLYSARDEEAGKIHYKVVYNEADYGEQPVN